MAFSLNFGDAGALSAEKHPSIPQFQEKIDKEIKRINYITTVNILKGFDYEVNGTTYHFSFDSDDQANFTQEQIRAAQYKENGKESEYVAYWRGHTDAGAVTLTFDYNGFIALLLHAGENKSKQLGAGWVLKDKIKSCTNALELKNMVDALQLVQLEVQARAEAEAAGITISLNDAQ